MRCAYACMSASNVNFTHTVADWFVFAITINFARGTCEIQPLGPLVLSIGVAHVRKSSRGRPGYLPEVQRCSYNNNKNNHSVMLNWASRNKSGKN